MPKKRLRALRAAYPDLDFDTTRGGHIAVRRDGRRVATVPATPSDWRGDRNDRATIRRATRSSKETTR